MSAFDDYMAAADEKYANAPDTAVAGPTGMTTAFDKYFEEHGGSVSQVGTGGPVSSQTSLMRQWYSGQNLNGPGNGWNTEFQKTFQSQVDRSLEEQDPYGFFQKEDATGVVTWDNAKGRDSTLKFGDIVVDGEKVGNVYDDFDRHTANVMMGEYLIQTATRKQELNQSGDVEKAYDEELTKLRAENTHYADVAPRAKEFEKAVEEEYYDEDADRLGIVAAGAGGGAIIGGGIGSVVPVIGTAVGAGVGAAIGGLGAWLNSDSLTYQVARSKEQYRLASEEDAKIQALWEGIGQGAMSIGLSPVKNIYQGTYDLFSEGGVTGGAVGGAFQETDEEGNRKAGAVWQVLDIAAMVADSALQFASPAGRLAYQAQMTTQIGSGVYAMLPGVGQWDERMLAQNSVWTRRDFNPETGEYEEHFDLGNSLAGIGAVGIDAVQLAGMSSLARNIDRSANQVARATGSERANFVGKKLSTPFAAFSNRLERVGLSKEQRALVKSGQAEIEVRSGIKFVVDDAGNIVGKNRPTLAVLAPSEGLQAVTAKMLARRDAAKKAGAYSSEQLYQTASELALGQRGVQAILVNAFGEGQEELLQGLLNPWSQDYAVDGEELMRSTVAGFASGFGMTFGARLGNPTRDQRMFVAGSIAHAMRTGGQPLRYDEWTQMSELEKRTLLKSANGLAESLTDGAFKKLQDERTRAIVGSTVEADRVRDHLNDEAAAALQTGTTATDQASPIVQHESASHRADAISTSHTQLLEHQRERTRGARKQVLNLQDLIKDSDAKLRAKPGDPDETARNAELVADRDALKYVVSASEDLERTIEAAVVRIDEHFAADRMPEAELEIESLNFLLEGLFDMTELQPALLRRDGSVSTRQLTDEQQLTYSRAVSRMMTRDPNDASSSQQLLLPQVEKVWALRKADDLYGVSQIILQGIRGDYDGDKMRALQQVSLKERDYVNVRSGANILGLEAMPEIGSTKFEAEIARLVMNAWKSKKGPVRQAARAIADNIERDLMNRYHNPAENRTPIRIAVIEDVSKAARQALRDGGDVRETVLTMMSERAGNELSQVGRGEYWRPGMPKLSNEMYWLANMVTRRMQEFQSVRAAHTPSAGKALPENVVTAPARTSTKVPHRVPLRGSTQFATLYMEQPGQSGLRLFQQLHYSLWESTEIYAGWPENGPTTHYEALVQFYETLSQGVNAQKLDRKGPSDYILSHAMAQLEELNADPVALRELGITDKGNLAVLANLAVNQVVYAKDSSGDYRLQFTGRKVSLAQHLLYMSLEQYKRSNRDVWDKNADMKGAYNSLMELTKPQVQGVDGAHKGNAEMAFVTLFENVRLYDLVGANAVDLGVMRTVGQVYRELMSMDVRARKDEKYRLREGVYREADKELTIPYGREGLESSQVVGYKSLVDALFSAADSTLSQNLTGKDKGKIHGRLKDKDDRRSEEFTKTWGSVRSFLQQVAPKTGMYTAEEISLIANERSDFGRLLLKVIPAEAMDYVYKGTDEKGNVRFASWFYEVWTAPTAAEAEMLFWRNWITYSWYAKVNALDIENAARSEDSPEKRIKYHSLTSRMHRLMFQLAADSAVDNTLNKGTKVDVHFDPTPMQQFLTKLNDATSLPKFMDWVNTEPGLVVDSAPLLAWVDDTAEFDAERAGGGWTQNLSTPSLIEHIKDLRTFVERSLNDQGREKARADADITTARAIKRWADHLRNPGNPDYVADPDDKKLYDRLAALMEASAKRRMTNGPRAMLQHTAHLVYGMYGPSHAKAAHPEQMAANAALEAQDNAFGYLTTPERILGELTVHNEDAVASAPQLMLRDEGRTMTNDGAMVKWKLDSVEAILPLLLNREHHAFARSMLFDTVIELDTDNVPRRKFLMGSSLEDVLKKTSAKDLFPENGHPGLSQSMKYLAQLEMKLRDSAKHTIEQRVTEAVILEAAALGREASFEDIQAMTVKAYMRLADALQVVGGTQKEPGKEDPAIAAWHVLREAALKESIARAYGIDVVATDKALDAMKLDIIAAEITPLRERANALNAMATEPKRSKAERKSLLKQAEAQADAADAHEAKLEQLFDLNVTGEIVARYLYNPKASDQEKKARQNILIDYVYEHGELVQAAGPALPVVQAIWNHLGERPRHRRTKRLKLTDKDWETLSSVVISVDIQRLLTVGPADRPPPPYPAPLKDGVAGLDPQRYWDHSGSFVFDFLSPDEPTGIVEAARELAREAGRVMPQHGATEIVQKVASTMLKPELIGAWDPSVPAHAIESLQLLQGSSAVPVVSMYGLLQRRWGAAWKATVRQTTDTVADATVTLTGEELDWERTNAFHDVEVTAGNGRKYKRPLAQMNNRFVEELTWTFTDLDGQEVTEDLMRPNIARYWLADSGSSPATRLREVNVLRLRKELMLALQRKFPKLDEDTLGQILDDAKITMKFVNPDAQPATGQDAQGNDLGALHANSVWHEGTVYRSDGDYGDSLLKAFFYGVGALNARGQQAALDTRKLMLMGIEDYERTSFEAVRQMEQLAGTDFARMLGAKTNRMMQVAISGGKPIDIDFWNAAYKLMKLKHWLEGTDAEGNRVRWSAEQVIEWQMQNPDVDVYGPNGPLENAELWMPSADVLADMMGDVGLGGVTGRLVKEEVTTDLTRIPRYTSRWTETMERRFPIADAKPKTILDTAVRRQAHVSDLHVSNRLTPEERTRFQRRVEAMKRRRKVALDQRQRDAQRSTFSPKNNMDRNKDLAIRYLWNQDLTLDLKGELAFMQKEAGVSTLQSVYALEQYTSELRSSKVGELGASFWVFEEDGLADPENGRITKEDTNGSLTFVPGEVVLFDTAQYRGMDPDKARELAKRRIDYFVNQHVALMITSSNGMSDLTHELQWYAREQHRYQRYMNQNAILIPDVFDTSDFQNVAAAKTRLTAPTRVPIHGQQVTLLVRDQELEESTMWVRVDESRSRFSAVQAVFDLLPIDAHSQYNTAVTSDDADRVLDYLTDGLGAAGVKMLQEEASRHLYKTEPDGSFTLKNGKKQLKGDATQEDVDAAEQDFRDAWDRLIQVLPDRVKNFTTAPLVGERIEIGDIIPLIGRDGEIMLYRHGYYFPDEADYRRQLTNQTPHNEGERGIVTYGGKPAPAATVHGGVVASIEPANNRGFRMGLEIDVQELGSKIIIERNGVKYLKTHMPEHIKMPTIPVYGDIEIEGVASQHDASGKDGTEGYVNSFQEAFAFFGIDFMPDLQRFFGFDSQSETYQFLKRVAALPNKMDVDEIYWTQSVMAGQDAYVAAISRILPDLEGLGEDLSSWLSDLADNSFEATVARATLMYLMSPNPDVESILYSSGLFVDDPSLAGAATLKMPELFTRAFDMAKPGSKVKQELARRLNDKLNRQGGQGWYLNVNSWELEGWDAQGNTIRGVLQYAPSFVSDDNPLLNRMAQERKDKQSVSRHAGLMNDAVSGGVVVPDQKKLNRLTAVRQQQLPTEAEPGALWHDLTYVDKASYGAGTNWQRHTPTEHDHYSRSMQRYAMYRQRIRFTGDQFSDKDRSDIKEAIDRVVNRLGLRPSQEDLVHYWIRQMLYHPAEGADQEAFSDDLAPTDVLGALRSIHDNLEAGYLPTYDSAGPSFFSAHDLYLLFHAYRRGESKWAPIKREGSRARASRDDLGEWISIAFGQAINEQVQIDPIFRVDLDGFFNTYQTVLRNSGYAMNITMDPAFQTKLLDPKTNELKTVTLDPVQRTRLGQPELLANGNLEYEDLMQGASYSDDPRSRESAVHWRQRRLKARAQWRARRKVHPVKPQSARDFLRNGTERINTDADQHSLQRIVIAMRHGTAMLNPGLYAMMIPEQGHRMFINMVSGAVSGESTLRSVTRVTQGVESALRATGVEALSSKLAGRDVKFQLNQYTPEQIDQMNNLFSSMGNDGAFTSLIIKDMMWTKNPNSPGKVVDFFERYAAFGNRWQDPTWGTTQRAMSRHYFEAIMRIIHAQPTRYAMTTDSVIAALRTDPAYFAKKNPELHKMASNAVVDFRSLKHTPLSLALKSLYEPWATSPNTIKRTLGTMLKLQLMYANYNANVLTTITGMQGYSNLVAVLLDGRKKPGNTLVGRWWKGVLGKPITDEDNKTFDMSSTLDGVTIANSFIKGGVTQTGLFMLGMITGGVLSGEDEEAKRRRRMAQAQNAHVIMDPRRLELDFRNKDALFLDWLPEQMAAWFRPVGDDGEQGARSVVQLSWLMKPFLNPIMGMERFFMTGDFSYITHAFADAVGSMPLFNKAKWDDAVRTAEELRALAAEQDEIGTPLAAQNSLYLYASAVGVFESMLVENMFLNSLYTGFDQYDRDPTLLVLRDSDGDIQRTIEGDARKNDVATRDFLDENGQIGTGYQKRGTLAASLAAYTENNLTAAAALSLFKPIHHQEFFRGDMPIKQRKIKRPELTEEEARVAVLLGVLSEQAQSGQPLERRMSLQEITAQLKQKYTSEGDWDSYNNLDALALQYYNSKANPVEDPLSILGPEGQEVLTSSGHAALFNGLMGGTITLDSPEMQGIAITQEQREKLETEFVQDKIAQGKSLGLTQTQAEYRAKRLLLGPLDNGSIPGFKEILWDQRIPWTPDVRYKQLNTTYIQGPDGFPWATGWKRGGAPGFGGAWSLIGGFKLPTTGLSTNDYVDGRLNTVDAVRGLNTGLRGLIPFDESELVPTDWEQTQKIIDAIEGIDAGGDSGPATKQSDDSGSGRGRFYRGSGGGGYSSRGYSPTIYWTRQPTLPRGSNIYGNSARNLFWDNGLIRRTTIRRERYQSTRERLKQWQ